MNKESEQVPITDRLRCPYCGSSRFKESLFSIRSPRPYAVGLQQEAAKRICICLEEFCRGEFYLIK